MAAVDTSGRAQSSRRLKGLECALSLTVAGSTVASVTKITTFEVNLLREVLTEEYIGEGTPDFDDISNGVELKLTNHHDDAGIFEFFTELNDRSMRLGSAAVEVNASVRCEFPSGRVRRMLLQDLFFGDLGFAVASRKAFSSTDITGNCKRATYT